MVLVIGVTDQLGVRVADTLLAEGARPRIVTTSPATAWMLIERGAETIQGDLRDADTVRRAFAGVERVVAAAAPLAAGASDVVQRRLIDAAQEARVSHFALVSALGASPHHPLASHRRIHSCEAQLRTSGLSHTIIRIPTLMEAWAGRIGDSVVDHRRVTIVGTGRNPINLMALDDVSHYVLVGLDHPEARNRIIDVGGPQNLSALEVVERFERLSGHHARRRHIPVPVVRVASVAVRPVDAALSRRLEAAAHLATSDQTFDPSATLEEFPRRLTNLETFARRRYRSRRHAARS